MLDPQVVDRCRRLLDVRLKDTASRLQDEVCHIKEAAAGRGALHSSSVLGELRSASQRELDGLAKGIRENLMRVCRTFRVEPSESLRESLQAELREELHIAATQVGGLLLEAANPILKTPPPTGWYELVDELAFLAERESTEVDIFVDSLSSETAVQERRLPDEVTKSIESFRRDHPEPSRTAFVMMDFAATPQHDAVWEAIRSTLLSCGIEALRADGTRYHDDLYPNVLTYMHGCSFGIAVMERILSESHNPNVAFEVGYMKALDKPVCLLKDKTYDQLQADLVGKLWDEFDPHDSGRTVAPVLTRWMKDKHIIPAEFTATQYKILNTLWINQVNKYGRPGTAFTFRLNDIADDYIDARTDSTPLIARGLIREHNGHYVLTDDGFDFCKKHHREFPPDHWFDAELDPTALANVLRGEVSGTMHPGPEAHEDLSERFSYDEIRPDIWEDVLRLKGAFYAGGSLRLCGEGRDREFAHLRQFLRFLADNESQIAPRSNPVLRLHGKDGEAGAVTEQVRLLFYVEEKSFKLIVGDDMPAGNRRSLLARLTKRFKDEGVHPI